MTHTGLSVLATCTYIPGGGLKRFGVCEEQSTGLQNVTTRLMFFFPTPLLLGGLGEWREGEERWLHSFREDWACLSLALLFSSSNLL